MKKRYLPGEVVGITAQATPVIPVSMPIMNRMQQPIFKDYSEDTRNVVFPDATAEFIQRDEWLPAGRRVNMLPAGYVDWAYDKARTANMGRGRHEPFPYPEAYRIADPIPYKDNGDPWWDGTVKTPYSIPKNLW